MIDEHCDGLCGPDAAALNFEISLAMARSYDVFDVTNMMCAPGY